jgi:cell division septation protein DedD
VVRVDTTVTSPVPRSGDVDLSTARQPLLPETASEVRTSDRDIPLTITSPGETPSAEPEPVQQAEPVQQDEPVPQPEPMAQPAPIAQPTPDGVYALQVSSFASETSALALRDDLQARAYPVHVRAASTPTGAMVYRVWVGYFRNREAAVAYAAAHPDAFAGATPVHR